MKDEIIISAMGRDSSLLNPFPASQKIKPILAPKKIIKTTDKKPEEKKKNIIKIKPKVKVKKGGIRIKKRLVKP